MCLFLELNLWCVFVIVFGGRIAQVVTANIFSLTSCLSELTMLKGQKA